MKYTHGTGNRQLRVILFCVLAYTSFTAFTLPFASGANVYLIARINRGHIPLQATLATDSVLHRTTRRGIPAFLRAWLTR